MSYSVKGTIKVMGQMEKFPSGFSKRVVVLSVKDGEYENLVPISFVKDKTSLIGKSRAGDQVEIEFDIRGREYKGNYYTDLVGWRVNTVSDSQQDSEEPF